jgi:hypothetical protein
VIAPIIVIIGGEVGFPADRATPTSAAPVMPDAKTRELQARALGAGIRFVHPSWPGTVCAVNRLSKDCSDVLATDGMMQARTQIAS